MSNMNLGATRSGKISSSRAQKINIYETMTWIMVMVMMMAMPCSIEPMNYRWACEEEEIAAELATEFSFASSYAPLLWFTLLEPFLPLLAFSSSIVWPPAAS